MAEKKKEAKKKEAKKNWKITAPGWAKPILRPKAGTSAKALKSIKSKKGYKVEEA